MWLTRRSFIAGVLGAAAVASAAGCKRADNNANEAWASTEDNSLPALPVQASGEEAVAKPGEAWVPRDGFIQLQLGGGSIPGVQVESVVRDGSALTVRLKSQDGPQTMDFALTEFRLEGGDVSAIETVEVDDGSGNVREIERSRQ